MLDPFLPHCSPANCSDRAGIIKTARNGLGRIPRITGCDSGTLVVWLVSSRSLQSLLLHHHDAEAACR